MEQQQFKVRFSLGTRLLLSIVLLLTLIIGFLNLSTVFLVRDDKRAYVYDTQATTGMLAGREFVNRSRHALDTLRILLATIDPTKPITPDKDAALKAILENQTEVLWVDIRRVDLKTSQSTRLYENSRAQDVKDLGIDATKLDLPVAWFNAIVPELTKSSYAFVNLSQVGGPPLVGVLFIDSKLLNDPAGAPYAMGVMSLKGFGDDLRKVGLTVATRSGWVLFDTDPAQQFGRANVLDDPLLTRSNAMQLTTGATEFDVRGTQYLGSYAHPGLDLVVLTRTEWKQAMSATYNLIEKFILLGGMAVGSAIIFAILFSKSLTAPINRLYGATEEVAKGNFGLSIEVKGRDEISALTSSFNVMSKRISDLMVEQARKLHLENELAIASTVQQTLIPPNVFRNEKIFIRSHYQAADECGGDWWGYFGMKGKLCLMIADATGHGLSSALITASARSCFSVMAKLAQEDPDFTFSPSAMLQFANRVVYDASMGKVMMTFFMAVLDFAENTMTYSSAGHNPPWYFKSDGNGGFAMKSLVSIGTRLGESRDVGEFEEKTIPIAPNDILLLYTDGLMEGKNVGGEMYGKKRSRKVTEAALDGGPEKIVTQLMADFLEYNKGKALDDDITLAAAVMYPGGLGAGGQA